MIKHLTLENGEKLPVRIAYSALKKFKEETGKSLMSEDALKDIFSGDVEVLLYYSLQKGFKVEGRPFEYKKEDMEDILDEVLFDFIKLIPLFFPKTDEIDPPLPKASKPQKK
jgi:hypothetical protein